MAAKKKARAKGGKATASRTSMWTLQSTSTVDSPTVRLMVVCFTLLCFTFAIEAFWRYGR